MGEKRSDVGDAVEAVLSEFEKFTEHFSDADYMSVLEELIDDFSVRLGVKREELLSKSG